MTPPPLYMRNLLRKIVTTYDLGELRILLFGLGIEWGSIRGETTQEKVIALIEYLLRRGELEKLVEHLREDRPNEEWDEPPPPEKQIQDARDNITEEERGAIFEKLMLKVMPLATDVIRIRSHVRSHIDSLNPKQIGELMKFLSETHLVSYVDFKSISLRGEILADATLNYVNLFGVDLRFADLTNAKLRFADLRYADLNKTILREANLSSANLTEADLTGADLGKAILYGAYLNKAGLEGACLIEADLTGAFLIGADLRFAELRVARLTIANLTGAILREADLKKADLREANLREVDFCGADLSEADLSGASLKWAELKDANFTGANLSGSNLSGAHDVNLDNAKLDELTILPNGKPFREHVS